MPNLFRNIPAALPDELVETLEQGSCTRIERIVSRGHRSPADFWYDQDRSEFVLLLSGFAVLEFERQPEPVEMNPGDWVVVPAHARHRVLQTAENVDTVWLAIHYC
jgi:cupin 2 domain-containing protein